MPASSYTLLDAIKTVGFRVGNFKQNIETVASPDLATLAMVENVNEVLAKIVEVKGLPSMNGRQVISMIGAESGGTVFLQNGITEVQGVATQWSSALVGAAFCVNSFNVVYRVASVSSPTSLDLDRAWSDSSSVDGQYYTIAQDRYDLPDDFYDFISVSLEGGSSRQLSIKKASEIDFQRYSMRGTALLTGAPNIVSVFDRGAGGAWQCHVDPFPDNNYQMQVMYRRRLTLLRNDNDVLPIPDETYPLLVRGATANWKEFTGVQGYEGAYKKWIADELAFYASFDSRTTDEQPRMVPSNTSRNQLPSSGLGYGA